VGRRNHSSRADRGRRGTEHRHGFETLRFDRVEASTDTANAASVRVMERAGMQCWKREMTNGLDTICYCIDHSSLATKTRRNRTVSFVLS